MDHKLDVKDITILASGSNFTLFELETPEESTNLYSNDTVCFFVIGRR